MKKLNKAQAAWYSRIVVPNMVKTCKRLMTYGHYVGEEAKKIRELYNQLERNQIDLELVKEVRDSINYMLETTNANEAIKTKKQSR